MGRGGKVHFCDSANAHPCRKKRRVRRAEGEAKPHYQAISPPSITSSVPVTHADSSDAR